ncbi:MULTISPECIES: DnaJ domain-containing protein [unclassified Paenibacillus]|uniref:J domain-containing protein n=1 Tax=unclassified Paenibacillus TaxID=185978 RepID=UPI00240563F1|nr:MULTISPECIES: DnaJ domain-containing protein [unclassified Paenibacillus]MDF9842486.1 curved DNA-binding protein CbpA [Paenibacillus sp. PastF-2]MDF9849076.1 curved DNA-binding protein CbpA [Paenibacillus sp. PastM-2]MDF9855646.1 curved DNA-binding protein CbpA [Paenibacillus sp. PastF-1]MDH6480918.1 curved DNA-binding protein CbpA [Paenibacillus sp. PastH-2]MDH6508340.1 curved DNA-binding protein CbpA [Paenibacillus sp. PastM-3]
MNTTSNTRKSGTGRGRKGGVPSAVNYYKVLGVRVNATPRSIKQGYIAKVKEFPPEHHPEEFQHIRKAYDILRDPAKRAEYDFTRKYGDSLDTILSNAAEAFATGNYPLAEELYHKALELHPGHTGAGVSLSALYLEVNKLSSFNKIWKELEASAADPQEKVTATIIKCRILMDYDRYEKALSVMRALDKKYRGLRTLYIMDYADMLHYNGHDNEAWLLFEETAEEVNEGWNENLGIEDAEASLNFYIHWIMMMFHLRKMQFWNKVKQRLRAFLRSLPEGELKELAVERLLEHSIELSESNAYKESLIFAELAYYIDPRNPGVLEQRRLAQEGNKLILEIDRLVKDKQIYPGVKIKAIQFFSEEAYGDFDEGGEEGDLFDMHPPGHIDELGGPEVMDAFMNEGIRHLKRKYPQVYKFYQEQWDKLLR